MQQEDHTSIKHQASRCEHDLELINAVNASMYIDPNQA